LKNVICPECSSKLNLKGIKFAYEDREYRCTECEWEGPIQKVKKEKKALTANAVRRGRTTKMSFNSLRQTNQKLAKHPELSKHKKEVQSVSKA
jgi:DNA-directed RNA polymerase subunit RPC12/RpoP